jgi:hypothetical protein
MSVAAFIIAILALIIAGFAFSKAGGLADLKKETAETLARLEKRLREEGKPGS